MISTLHELAPGGSFSQGFEVFAGPKKPDLLANYGLDELVYYGWFGKIAVPIAALLHGFYAVVGNYGLAIILLTVLVRGCMFPLSRKQAIGAQKMQELQPEIKRIQEKYKKDVEGRTKAQQELFRKHNYNPMSGCLVMFVQLPIFVALYRALMVDIELRQAPLISEAVRWCSNLAAPDMLFNWSSFMPEFVSRGVGIFGLGPYFNILPLVTIVLFICAAEDVHAAGGRRAGGHAAEGHAVHDDLHRHHVLQSGQRAVHLFHRLQCVGPGGTQVPAEDVAGRGRREPHEGPGQGGRQGIAQAGIQRRSERNRAQKKKKPSRG